MATRLERSEPPLVVIVGPTASGKTSLAIELAEKFKGEIICADSRTVYKAMDIGTAKPTKEDRARVPHWGLDLVAPDESFTAADFKAYATEKIGKIRSRSRIPLLVGGTGLYIDSVIFDYQFGPPPDLAVRQKLEDMTLEELQEYCYKRNIKLPENSKNKRYVIRAIEQKSINDKRNAAPADNTIVVGMATDKNKLRTRITARTEQLFENGVVDEATILGKKYGWETESMTGNIYPLVHRYLQGELAVSEVKEIFTTLDWRLARRQMAWFRRNPHIEWLLNSEVTTYLETLLAA